MKIGKEFDPLHDYTKDLEDGDLKHEGNRKFVYLRGLEKLARQRGVVSAKCIRMEPMHYIHSDGKSFVGGIYCTYEYTFADGGVYQGSADATIKNCDGNFKLYLTAMAESRAKARALRTSFGIGLCSVEEKSDETYEADNDYGPIDDAQMILIRTLAKQHNMAKEQVFELLDIPRSIKELRDLSKNEGRELAVKLNAHRPRRSKAKKIKS